MTGTCIFVQNFRKSRPEFSTFLTKTAKLILYSTINQHLKRLKIFANDFNNHITNDFCEKYIFSLFMHNNENQSTMSKNKYIFNVIFANDRIIFTKIQF